jgi:hypothetical protein
MTDPVPPFELAAAELRALGISLTRLPGEYRVNYRNGGDRTARLAEDTHATGPRLIIIYSDLRQASGQQIRSPWRNAQNQKRAFLFIPRRCRRISARGANHSASIRRLANSAKRLPLFS